ncbi:glycosyltransferase [Caldalkalibacillus horti]|uniref:Glycosyltransferase involved in cell wall biosynthesis n=1 Tax=Caldalkalibacillus horti TaxID=77523 RepID=A0ABT9W5R2_9BACI|nr:glycosyltransferase [Bacillus horti]MDQ0168470.1 glycosyltransferase involved in cell wall biosynthesis [Bacillus horti]
MSNQQRKSRVLIGSPINQKPNILMKFLESLNQLEQRTVELSFLFYDDNEDIVASQLLQDFSAQHEDCHIEKPRTTLEDSQSGLSYHRSEITHFWNEQLIWKVADFKDQIIKFAMEGEYDYLFLVDSDILLHSPTIDHLVSTDRDIISAIFWTKWQPHATALPQVWMMDEYQQYEKRRGEHLTEEEIRGRHLLFLSKLRVPGTYEVGGLGACTLISNKALQAGVSFKEIPNLSFWGEDRHFCVRAAALGYPLFVDTYYPAYHIYREADLEGVEDYKRQNQLVTFPISSAPPTVKNRLTLSMVIKNEADRYLTETLREVREYIDAAVIIDDGSEDQSVEIVKDILRGIPLHLVQNDVSKFSNEIILRKQQWEETIKTDPQWILNLDADECFEKKFKYEVKRLMDDPNFDVYCFRLYDFWKEGYYRDDQYWSAHLTYRPFLVRYKENYAYKWKETPVHCGRFPANIFQLPTATSELRLKHYGWMRQVDREKKYTRYMLQDPGGKYGWPEQYRSILDDNPNLVKWEE